MAMLTAEQKQSLERHLHWLYGPGGVYSQGPGATFGKCRCDHGWRSLGRANGINMGKGWVRLTTHPDCPHHGTKAEKARERRIRARTGRH